MNRSLVFIAVLLVCTIMISDGAWAGDFPKTGHIFGIRGGLFGGGDIDINDWEYQTENYYTIGGFWDMPITKNLYAGLSLDFNGVNVKVFRHKMEDVLINTSLNIKGHFPFHDHQVVFQPGIGFGYAIMDEFIIIRDSDYLTMRAFGEMIVYATGRYGFIGDMGFLWVLSGGDDNYDVSTGPLFVIRGGIVF